MTTASFSVVVSLDCLEALGCQALTTGALLVAVVSADPESSVAKALIIEPGKGIGAMGRTPKMDDPYNRLTLFPIAVLTA